MTDYLLDTNVVSELVKRRPHPQVSEWIDRSPSAFLSVLTIGELARGSWLLRRRDAVRADRLDAWLTSLRQQFHGRVLPVDEPVVDRWASLPLTRTLPAIDSLIAATAIAHGLTVATRNTRDFEGTAVPVIDPFSTGLPVGETDGQGHA